jgi:hypothetical protein
MERNYLIHNASLLRTEAFRPVELPHMFQTNDLALAQGVKTGFAFRLACENLLSLGISKTLTSFTAHGWVHRSTRTFTQSTIIVFFTVECLILQLLDKTSFLDANIRLVPYVVFTGINAN